MIPTRRVFFSGPRDIHLDDRQKTIKWGIVKRIVALGFEPQVFGEAGRLDGLPRLPRWSHEAAEDVMHRCVAAVVLGFRIRECSSDQGTVAMVSQYCQYEGAMARTHRLPILALIEDGVEQRAFFNPYAGEDPLVIPPNDPDWLSSEGFENFLRSWKELVDQRCDVFLGYCSRSETTAEKLRDTLEMELGVTVLDWRRDFRRGGTILEEITHAGVQCSAGIFLFTADDYREGSPETGMPRDNVVFEAGYFARAKGKERVLVILEGGVQLPADLGGVIYAPLPDKSDVSAVFEDCRGFVEDRL